jgi:negative modulator of initiation of replication
MRQIEIDDDVYEHLVRNARELGETASQILRRLLDFESQAVQRTAVAATTENELAKVLCDRRFERLSSVVDRFLFVLSHVYAEHKSEFQNVLSIKGRGREYFARRREDIERSGKSTQPKSIPNSPFWVMTNSPTPQKQEMLDEVLSLFGYSQAAIRDAKASLAAVA